MEQKNLCHFTGKLQATSVVCNSISNSLEFYVDGLGYKVLEEGLLTDLQKNSFGKHLGAYALVGHDRDCVIRLLESNDPSITRNRKGAKPYDQGLCVMEAGAADVDQAYQNLIRHRFGCITSPRVFSVDGPEPLGFVEMKAFGMYGPSGEQLFITQITKREGGIPLWEQRSDINVFPIGNVVLSMRDRSPQEFYGEFFLLFPNNDLPLDQAEAFEIMGGPKSMAFDMCLMGNGNYKSGMEQHVYGKYNPDFEYKTFPSNFSKLGLASACWEGKDLDSLKTRLIENNVEIISEVLLPIRGNSEPLGLAFRGRVGEIIELHA